MHHAHVDRIIWCDYREWLIRRKDELTMPDEMTQQLIDYFPTFVGQEITRQFGEEKAIPLHKLYDRQFKIHYNNCKHLMPDELSRHHGINSLAVIALDEVLMEVRAF